MKIIDIGKCIDNVDPLGIGRIRVSRYNEYTGQKEGAIDYEPWSDRDLFIANPFLPSNVNFIPEINQSVKIIQYNTDKDTVNVEYIAGPFTTMYDYNGQTFSQQIDNTTYGNANKERENIVDKNDKYIDKRTESSFAKKTDYGVYGKYGSDIIFTTGTNSALVSKYHKIDGFVKQTYFDMQTKALSNKLNSGTSSVRPILASKNE